VRVLVVAEAAGGTDPWWGDPVIAGGFLLLGAGLGFLFNWFSERRAARAKTKTRWDEELRQIAKSVVGAGTTIADLTSEHIALLAHDEVEKSSQRWDETGPRLERLRKRIEQHSIDLMLIGPEKVRDSGSRVAWAAVVVLGTLRECATSHTSRDEISGLIHEMNELRQSVWDFIDATRAHFGVESALRLVEKQVLDIGA